MRFEGRHRVLPRVPHLEEGHDHILVDDRHCDSGVYHLYLDQIRQKEKDVHKTLKKSIQIKEKKKEKEKEENNIKRIYIYLLFYFLFFIHIFHEYISFSSLFLFLRPPFF